MPFVRRHRRAQHGGCGADPGQSRAGPVRGMRPPWSLRPGEASRRVSRSADPPHLGASEHKAGYRTEPRRWSTPPKGVARWQVGIRMVLGRGVKRCSTRTCHVRRVDMVLIKGVMRVISTAVRDAGQEFFGEVLRRAPVLHLGGVPSSSRCQGGPVDGKKERPEEETQ